MNQNLGATVQSGGQQARPGQAASQAQGAAHTGLGQALPGTTPSTTAPSAPSAKGTAPAGASPAGSPSGATPPGTRPASSNPPGTPAPLQQARPGTMPTGTRPAGQMGPGTGVPNPNYRYNTKPPLLGTGLQRDILSLLIKIAVIAGAVVALFTFIFGVFQYTSASMDPHVKSGDLIMYSRFDTEYAAQDLVVLSYQGEMQVRRVVAIAGDTVDFEAGGLMVNGSRQQEAGIFTDTERYESEISFPLTVPAGHVFVLGDHRTGATDSRIYGPVATDDTLGKVTSIFRRRGL